MGIRSPCVLLSGISSFLCADFGFVKHPLHAVTLRRLVFKLFSCFSQENIATRSNIKKTKYTFLESSQGHFIHKPVIGWKKFKKSTRSRLFFLLCVNPPLFYVRWTLSFGLSQCRSGE